MTVEFHDNRIEVKVKMSEAIIAFLHEACGKLEAQTKRNSKVKTGQTKGAYRYAIDEAALTGYVGSSYDNAVWEEFGTGEYALNGDGHKGGWWIKVGNGDNEISMNTVKQYKWLKVRRNKAGEIEYVFTKGKKPRRPLFKAFTVSGQKIIAEAERILRERLGTE